MIPFPSSAPDAAQGGRPASKTDVRVKCSRSARQGERTTLDAAAHTQATAKGSQTKGLGSLPVGETRGHGGGAPGHRETYINSRRYSANEKTAENRASENEISIGEINTLMVGREIGRETYINGRIRDRELRQQSEHLAQRLANAGIEARNCRSDVTVIGLVSGEAEKPTAYRNCNIIPIQHLTETTKAGSLRMLVVSGGWVPLYQYREHHKAHTRRMSKFANAPLLKQLGIEVLFYNVENTIKRADDGRAMMNMHSHVLFKCARYLGARRWNAFLRFARDFFPKGYVHDSKVQVANEVVKYVFKPTEFEQLTDWELAELFHQTAGGRTQTDPETGEIKTRLDAQGNLVEVKQGPLKFFHPLGSFRDLRSELKANGQKLVKVPVREDEWEWRRTPKKTRQERDTKPSSGVSDNMVLAITRPMPKFTRRMEPCLIVQGYDGNLDRLLALNGLQEHAQEMRSLFAARVQADTIKAAQKATQGHSDGHEHTFGGPAPSMQHTTTTTVWENLPDMALTGPPGEPQPPTGTLQ